MTSLVNCSEAIVPRELPLRRIRPPYFFNLPRQELVISLLDMQFVPFSDCLLVLEWQVVFASSLHETFLILLINYLAPSGQFNKLTRSAPQALLQLILLLNRIASHLVDNRVISAMIILQSHLFLLVDGVDVLNFLV